MDKVVYYPLNHKNPYVAIVTEAIKNAGYEIYDMKDIKKNHKLAKQIKIINLNWFDSIGNCPLWKAIALLVRQLCRIEYYKWCGMKIIYTMHNRQAHDTKYKRINCILMNFLCKKSDYIAVLCSYSKEILREFLSVEEIEKKVRVMYHPSYKGAYSEKKIFIPELPNSSKCNMHILFMGSVRPYKNIELILEAAYKLHGKNIEFVIAGKANNKDYEKRLKDKVNHFSNVTFISRYIDDSEMFSFYDWADIVIIPLDMKSSLNSGSSVLAFTMGKTVIIPRIGTVRDFPSEVIFSYEYENESEHLNAIVDKINEAFTKWSDNPKSIEIMGDEIRKYLNNNFSKEKTEERYRKLYQEAIK